MLIAFYAAGFAIPIFFKRSFFQNLGVVRYALVMGLLLTMIGTAGKIILRLAFDVKYIIVTPWINL
jgi:uncharacterized transporter YbjL